MKKKLISVLLSAAMATTMLAGRGSTAADTGVLRQKRKQLRKRPRLQIPRQRLERKRLRHRRRQGLLLKLQTRAGR